jgi:hypothetical protein
MDRRLVLFSALAFSAALAGCTSTSLRPTASPAGLGLNLGMPVAAFDGTVTGGIYRCSALPPSLTRPPTRVAGTVDVFTDQSGTVGQASFTQALVTTGGTYTFKLPPGTYVLVGHWTGSNLSPPTATVTVTTGKIAHQDLDYQTCK